MPSLRENFNLLNEINFGGTEVFQSESRRLETHLLSRPTKRWVTTVLVEFPGFSTGALWGSCLGGNQDHHPDLSTV